MARVRWSEVLDRSQEIVESYETGVTLRQLFYRLVADQVLPNTFRYYQGLSRETAKARRSGWFPDLLDRSSRIEGLDLRTFSGPEEALSWLPTIYRRDRMERQPWQIWLGVEKAGMSAQLSSWFSMPYGISHIALGGFASQTLADQVARRIESDGRPAVFIYAGDHDPSGEAIDVDFEERVGCFDKVLRVALNADQLAEFSIPRNQLDPVVEAKLARDARAAAFVERHGYLDQYELDALPPEVLRRLYQEAVDRFLDVSAFEEVLEEEAEEIEGLLYGEQVPGG